MVIAALLIVAAADDEADEESIDADAVFAGDVNVAPTTMMATTTTSIVVGVGISNSINILGKQEEIIGVVTGMEVWDDNRVVEVVVASTTITCKYNNNNKVIH